MKEQLITFETAKLAKEKGFNIPTLYDFVKEWEYQLPTQSLLQKWLREKHDIDVLVYKVGSLYTTIYNGNDKNSLYNTYEIALEKGLLEALKLI